MTKAEDITWPSALSTAAFVVDPVETTLFWLPSRVSISIVSCFYRSGVQTSLQVLLSTFCGYVERPGNCGLQIPISAFTCPANHVHLILRFRRFFRVMPFPHVGDIGDASVLLVPFQYHRLGGRAHKGVV